MTVRGTWKRSERRIADILGGQRVPVSGRGRGDQPDVDGVSFGGRRLAIEHKYGARLIGSRLLLALDQARAARRSPTDIAAVTVEETGHGQSNVRLILLDPQQFADAVRWYENEIIETREAAIRSSVDPHLTCARCATGRLMVEAASCMACGWTM